MPYKDPVVARDYHRKYSQKRHDNNPECSRKEQYDWRKKNPKRYLLSRARGRAKVEGVPFAITLEDFEIPEFCPVFPELRLEFSNGRATRPDNIPSLDKIVPVLGYVPGNVAVISFRANRLKSDMGVNELKLLLAWLEGVTKPP